MICDKHSYEKYNDAKVHVRGLNIRLGNKKSTFRIYKCEDCGNFHVTTVYKNKLKRPAKVEKYKMNVNDTFILKTKNQKVEPIKRKHEAPTISTGKMMTEAQKNFLKRLVENNVQQI